MKYLRLGAAAALVCFAVSAGGHPATERYVPMGYWASVGVKNTYLGDVTEVASDRSSLAYRTEGRRITVRVDEKTRIYVDRTHLKKRNLAGTRSDLQAGRRMEVKLRKDGSGVAEWIKVRE